MLYWIKLCIIFIGILPGFTLRSYQYLMFYSLITPFWAQQYYASKLHSRQNKKFLKCTKEPYTSSRTWKINNKLIYVCSWAPLLGGPKMCKCLILNCDLNKEVPHAKILKCCFLNFLSVWYNWCARTCLYQPKTLLFYR